MTGGPSGVLVRQKTPTELLGRRWGRALIALFALGSTACGSPQRPAHLPPPTYEQPKLPPWEPEAPADASEDPLEGDLQGEWADEPPGSPERDEQPQPPENQDEGDPAPDSSQDKAPAESTPEDAPPAP